MKNRTTVKTAMESMLSKASLHWSKKAENKKFNARVEIESLSNCKVYDLFINGEMVYTAAVDGNDFKPFTFEENETVMVFENCLKERLYQ